MIMLVGRLIWVADFLRQSPLDMIVMINADGFYGVDTC